MKVVHFCMLDSGGAGNAAYRQHCALRSAGVESKFYVLQKANDDADVLVAPKSGALTGGDLWSEARDHWQKELDAQYPRHDRNIEIFTDTRAVTDAGQMAELKGADIVNFHWVPGLVDVERFAGVWDKPVVWTMHDMNPFTGGCHYSADCERYLQKCGDCPVLGSGRELDLSRLTWLHKKSAYARLRLTGAFPSNWLRDCAARSSLMRDFELVRIPYGLPTDVFKPYPVAEARKAFGVPEDALVVLFGAQNASNRRKGVKHLLAALEGLRGHEFGRELYLAQFGVWPKSLKAPFPVIEFGKITDNNAMAAIYSLADAFLLPSEQDNLPNVALESLACGTPVVGFHIGGMPDIVDHGRTGYLARFPDAGDVAKGVLWAAAARQDASVRLHCRRSALEKYGMAQNAERYVALYERLIENSQKVLSAV